MLKESVANVPMSFYVECKNNESAEECFAKISRKFKNKYGVIIESADVEQINEGLWDKLKAKTAGIAGAVGQSIKNGVTHTKNMTNAVKDMTNAAINAGNDRKSGKTTSTTELTQDEKRGSTRLAKSNAKIISLLKSQVKDLENLVKNVNDNFESLGVKVPDTLNSEWETLQQSINAYSKAANATIKNIKGTKNVKPSAEEQKPKDSDATNNASKENASEPEKKANSSETTEKESTEPAKNDGTGKKQRSEAQKAATAKMQAARKAKMEERKKAKEQGEKMTNDAINNATNTSEWEETPAKKKSSKKDPFAPNPFF